MFCSAYRQLQGPAKGHCDNLSHSFTGPDSLSQFEALRSRWGGLQPAGAMPRAVQIGYINWLPGYSSAAPAVPDEDIDYRAHGVTGLGDVRLHRSAASADADGEIRMCPPVSSHTSRILGACARGHGTPRFRHTRAGSARCLQKDSFWPGIWSGIDSIARSALVRQGGCQTALLPKSLKRSVCAFVR